MAGHSQFSNIKHRKNAQDSKRSQKFTKLIREITVAARQGLPDPELNPRLRSAIIAARKENLPKDKIETAIKNASGNITEENYEEVQYEGYGPSGTAFIIYAVTNNRNRTAAEIRHIFSRMGGNLGETGSVNYLFNYIGLVVYNASNINFDELFNYGIELGVLNVELQDGLYLVTCEVKNFGLVRDTLYNKFGEPEFARLAWQPKDPIEVNDEELAKKISALIEALEDNDDVQYVEGNFTMVYS
ncbi:transcriptional regulator [Wolbachia pipientis]|uniref:Probable transcriptional regulatory protein BIY23_00990 n=1 Tax=Wolbachia pipientis TaxID=955 RepID=A0A1E7QLF4_WOLPI|nr:YebC/PmpR family DNA-binding transcriptional regulator [Wolbachia pipientis]OEY87049.1 transcriptional regulator [Wolbachia pipientis]